MTRNQIIAQLAQEGYQPFMRPSMGSVIAAEAWTSRVGFKPLVIILYHRHTGELVDGNNIPQDEEMSPDILAFLDDFGDRVYRNRT
jgi:hypothetical protein